MLKFTLIVLSLLALVSGQDSSGPPIGPRDGKAQMMSDSDRDGRRRGKKRGGTLEKGESCTENRQCKSSCCDFPRKGGRSSSDSGSDSPDSSMETSMETSDDDSMKHTNRILQAVLDAQDEDEERMQCVSQRDCSVRSRRTSKLVPGIIGILLIASCVGLCFQRHHYNKKIAEMQKTMRETQMVEGAPVSQSQTAGVNALE